MKRARKVLSALFLAVAMVLLVFAFVACGEKSITGADIVNGELVLTYSDGTTDNLGSVVGPQGQTGSQGAAGTPGSVVTIGQNGNWFIDGVDTGKPAQGQAGAAGTPGSVVTIGQNGNWFIDGVDTGKPAQGQAGAAGEDGNDAPAISGIVAEYGFDEDGNKCIVFTFSMSDGSSYTVNCALPKEIADVYGERQYFEIVGEDEENPVPVLRVNYTDGSYATVPVTEDMIEFGSVDYGTAGIYYIQGEYQGFNFNIEIFVFNPDDDSVMSLNLSADRVIWFYDSDAGKAIPDFSGLELSVVYANGNEESIAVEEKMISFEEGAVNEVFSVNGTYQDKYFSFDVLLLNRDEVSFYYANYEGERDFEFDKDDRFEVDGLVVYGYNFDGSDWYYFQKLESDMLFKTEDDSPLDMSAEGEAEYYIKSDFGDEYIGTIYIRITDWSRYTLETVYLATNEIKVSADGKAPELRIRAYYKTAEGEYATKYIALTEEMVLNLNEIDFSKAGTYTLKYTYENQSWESNLVVYNPETDNVREIFMLGFDGFEIKQNADLKAELAKYLQENNCELVISYYESVNGEIEKRVQATADMFLTDGFDVSKLGYFELKFTYDGKEGSVMLNIVPDMSDAKEVGTYRVDEVISEMLGASSVTLYDNGMVQLAGMWCQYETEGTTVKVVVYNETMLFNIDETEKKISTFAASGEPQKTYSNKDLGMEIKVYDGYLQICVVAGEASIPVVTYEIGEDFDGTIDFMGYMTLVLNDADSSITVVA